MDRDGEPAALRRFGIRPAAPLRAHVDRIWGWHSADGTMLDLPTLLPGTGADVFFHYGKPFVRIDADGPRRLDRTHLVCVRRRPIRLQASDGVGFVAVRFRAGSLHRFTDVPVAQLADQTLCAGDLWGEPGRRLAGDVDSAPSRQDRLDRIQRFLLDRFEAGRPDPLIERATAAIYRDCATLSIDRLARCLGITRRQLERRFRAATGQTPVQVRRASRLQKVVRELLLDHSANLLDVALGHGYYDQAHFIHCFSELGLGPPRRHLAAARTRAHFYNPPWDATAATGPGNGRSVAAPRSPTPRSGNPAAADANSRGA